MKQLLAIFLLLSLFSTAFAVQAPETYSQNEIIQLMSNIEPYLKLNTDKTVSFDYAQANGKLDTYSLEIGKTYERFHNSTINELKNGQKPFQSEQDRKDLKLFEPFYAAVIQKGALTTNDLLKTVPNTLIIPKQANLYSSKTRTLSFSPKSSPMTLSFTCNGGSILSPAFCPAWSYPSTLYSSQSAAASALTGQGFHNTYSPGCYSGSCATDYTKWLNANGCNYAVFRTQAITYTVNTSSGIKWKYRYQTPEPNPEIYSYIWPAIWWGPYVAYWHQAWPQPNGQLGC